MLKIAVKTNVGSRRIVRQALLSGLRKAVADGSLLDVDGNGEHSLVSSVER